MDNATTRPNRPSGPIRWKGGWVLKEIWIFEWGKVVTRRATPSSTAVAAGTSHPPQEVLSWCQACRLLSMSSSPPSPAFHYLQWYRALALVYRGCHSPCAWVEWVIYIVHGHSVVSVGDKMVCISFDLSTIISSNYTRIYMWILYCIFSLKESLEL